jgi:DNA (cytosine-5)-methyltransferase 1
MKRLLDLYCGQGGASKGYADAGFEVFGIDIDPQPRYPFGFLRMDALAAMRFLLDGYKLDFGGWGLLGLDDFDAIHASPPCQLYSLTHRIMKSDFPDLIGPTREMLEQTGLPWVIENVTEAAPEMREPVMLCGAMFEIETYRHRLFETSFPLTTPEHPVHVAKTTKMGRRPIEGQYMHLVGNFTDVDRGRKIMGMPWASRDGIREAIPPCYSAWVGSQIPQPVSTSHNSTKES